ncbi:transposase [Heyndrickxia sporothermodurans]|uniref:Transposase n=1 Tax=Heyndrickxia sporothermodurans TaxID=46224 RepID=A0AB37HSG1_9BACI|nr:transposase [Heyndrickxia sporothermodurans]
MDPAGTSRTRSYQPPQNHISGSTVLEKEGPSIILYDYQETRSGKNAEKFLSGFKGYLQVDGYAGYHKVPNVKLVGCMAHARRKFDEALKVLPSSKRLTSGVANGRSPIL